MALSLGALTVAIGAAQVSDQSMWMDEAYTALRADGSIGDLWRLLRSEGGMFPYFLAVRIWRFVGDSDGWLRMLSVLGGAVAVAVTYRLAVRLGGRRIALPAVAMLVLNPFFQYFLVELRAYSWVMAAASSTTLLFLRFHDRPTAVNGVLWGVSSGLLASLIVFSGGLPASQFAIAAPMLRDRRRRSWSVAAAAALMVVAPTLPAMFSNDQVNWIPATTPARVGSQLLHLVGGRWWAIFLGAGVAVTAIRLARRRRAGAPDTATEIVLAGAAAVPIGLLVLCVVQPLFLYRYMAAAAPLIAVLAANGWVNATSGIFHRRAEVAPWLVVAASALMLRGSPLDAQVRPVDLRSAAGALRPVRAGDEVRFDSDFLALTIGRYWATPTGVSTALGVPAADDACHTWYVFQTDRSGLQGLLAAVPGASSATISEFTGISVADVDRCG